MENVLIHYADDDVDDLELFKKAVEKSGVKASVNLYNNGDDLLRGINNSSLSDAVIFLDINMPVKSGLAVLKEIRQKKELEKLSVIIYSTSDDPNAIMASREIGASLYIVKPSSFLVLKELVKRIVEIKLEGISYDKEPFVFDILKQSNG